ncbi:MAG: hypothetical protein ACKOZL_04395 [Actinomycetes bacterium]
MQPFERLRAAVRWSSGLDEWSLLAESIQCLAGFGDDPAGLVMACRRLLVHHPSRARLWWVCARVATAIDPVEAAWDAWDRLELDATPSRISAAVGTVSGPVVSLGWDDTVETLARTRPDLEVLAVRTGDDAGLSMALRRSEIGARVVDVIEATALEPAAVLVPVAAAGAGTVLLAPEAARTLELLRSAAPALLVAPLGTVLPEGLLGAYGRANDGRVASVPFDSFAGALGPTGLQDHRNFPNRRDTPEAPEFLRLTV